MKLRITYYAEGLLGDYNLNIIHKKISQKNRSAVAPIEQKLVKIP